MYIDNEMWIPDKNYRPYVAYPGKIGGMCIHLSVVEWFINEMYRRQSYMEIGSLDGILISVLAERYKDKKFLAVDAFAKGFDTDQGHLEYFIDNNLYNDNVYLRKDYSEDILPRLTKKFDLIFVDGDHSYETTKGDLTTSWDLLEKGGRLVLHDFKMVNVGRAAMDFSNKLKKSWREAPPELVFIDKE